MHDLRLAYITKCKELGVTLRGDKDVEKTVLAAQKISRLGISYAEYMDLAFALLKPMCQHQGWRYPWYNIVISPSVISRIRKLLELEVSSTNTTAAVEQEALLADEFQYLLEYVSWVRGDGDKPVRYHISSYVVKKKAAEKLCSTYGIPVIYDYNKLAQALVGYGKS